MSRIGAIVLSGGRARRLGGVDKGAVTVGERTLLEHAVAAVADHGPIAVVGPEAPPGVDVTLTREHPAGGGPAAGVAAGLAALPEDVERVVVLACDVPGAARVVPLLLGAVPATDEEGGPDGAWAVDQGGRAQPLLAVYRAEALARAVAALDGPDGASMRALTRGLAMREIAVGDAARDADTWEDVHRLREEWS